MATASSGEEKVIMKTAAGMVVNGGTSPTLFEEMKVLKEMQDQNGGVRKAIHTELWHACAGPLVYLPQVGSLVYYFPQGHSEQVAASTKRSATTQIPNYPNLPSQLLCQVHNVTLHADRDTDEIFAQMSLQPVKSEKDIFQVPDFGLRVSKQPTEYFCKTLTASDTSTHGGFSVPRRAAEKLFPPLDYTMQPPSQELVVRDLHDNTWTFRHIYRGQPKRHLLTTGWSVFVGSKRLRAGDSVLFIRDEKSQLMVGVRRANRQQTTLPSSVLSADSMHIGVLAAAAHASVNRTPFTVFYNPRACPADFVIPVNKYRKAIHGTQISVGMRFGMMFETEESGKRRYMGTIVGINDLDSLRWPGSKWRNLQVEWDEPGCGDKQNRVSAWDIETPESLFLFPSLTSGFKRPFPPNFIAGGGDYEWSNLLKRPLIHQTPPPEIGCGGGGNHIFPYPVAAAAAMPNLCSDQLIKMLIQSQNPNYPLPPQGGPSSLSSSSSSSPYLTAANVLEAANSTRLQQPYSSQQLPTAQPSMQNNNPSTTQSSFLNQQQNTHYQVQQTNKPEEESRQTNKNTDQDMVGSTAPSTTTTTDNKAAKTPQTEPAATSRRRHETCGEVSQQLPTSSTISSVQCNKEKQLGSSSNLNQQQQTTIDVLPLPNNDNATHRLTQQQPQPSLGNHHQFHDQSSQTTTTTTTSAALLPPPPLETYQFHQLTNLDLPDHWLPCSVPSTTTTTTTTTLQSLAGFPQSPSTLSMFGKLDTYLSSTLPDAINNPMLTPMSQDMWDHSQPQHHQVPYHGNLNFGNCEPQPSMGGGGGLDNTTVNDQSEIYSSLEIDHISNVGVGNNGISNRFVVDPSAAAVSGYDGGQFGGGGVCKEISAGFQYSSDCIGAGNFNSSQDLQSQITSAASLVDSQAFSFQQELQDNSGGTSSSNVDFDECSLMQSGSWQPVATAAAAPPPLRSFTKVQKAGSVGRSIDVTSFKSYDELRSAIECMFGLDGLLCDPRGGSGWKLVYVDFENDVLLVGDDPWEEFVSCVRCIRILSPSEVKQMSEEGLQLLNAQAANA